MANGQDERGLGSLAPPSSEEADRLAEQFRPSWEVEEPVEAHAVEAQAVEPAPVEPAPVEPAPAPPPVTGSAPSPQLLKQTLVGIQTPNVSSPPALGKRTLVGIGINDIIDLVPRDARPQSPNAAEPPLPPGSDAPSKKTSSRPPTPVPSEVFDGSAEPSRPVNARVEPQSKPFNGTLVATAPSGVAKSYRPKEGPDVPAVVVAPAALAASDAAARSRSRSSRLRETQTIPMRTVSGASVRQLSLTPRRKAKPLWLAVVLGLSVGVVAALSLILGEERRPGETVGTGLERADQRVGPRSSPETPAAVAPAATREPFRSTTPTSIKESQSARAALPHAEENSPDTRPDGAASAPPTQKTTSNRKTPPKKASSVSTPEATPAKSKAVIVRESPF